VTLPPLLEAMQQNAKVKLHMLNPLAYTNACQAF